MQVHKKLRWFHLLHSFLSSELLPRWQSHRKDSCCALRHQWQLQFCQVLLEPIQNIAEITHVMLIIRHIHQPGKNLTWKNGPMVYCIIQISPWLMNTITSADKKWPINCNFNQFCIFGIPVPITFIKLDQILHTRENLKSSQQYGHGHIFSFNNLRWHHPMAYRPECACTTLKLSLIQRYEKHFHIEMPRGWCH